MERAVQYVRGNFFAGETFAGLADAQARARSVVPGRAGMRIHGTTQCRPREVFAAQEAAGAAAAAACRMTCRCSRRRRCTGTSTSRSTGRLYSAPQQHLGRHLEARAGLGAGQAVPPRRAGQAPSPPAAGRRSHRPGRPARGQGHLRDARRRLAGAAAAGTATRSASTPSGCWTPPAVDEDAAGLPAARPGPKSGPARSTGLPAGAGRRSHRRHQIAACWKGDREHAAPPPRPAAAAAARFARDPAEFRPVQLTLIPGGEAGTMTATIPSVARTCAARCGRSSSASCSTPCPSGSPWPAAEDHPRRVPRARPPTRSPPRGQSAGLRARAAGLDPAMSLDTWDDTAEVSYDRRCGTSWPPCASSTARTAP